MIISITYQIRIMRCYVYLLNISYSTNKCEIDSLNIIKHEQIYVITIDIDSE